MSNKPYHSYPSRGKKEQERAFLTKLTEMRDAEKGRLNLRVELSADPAVIDTVKKGLGLFNQHGNIERVRDYQFIVLRSPDLREKFPQEGPQVTGALLTTVNRLHQMIDNTTASQREYGEPEAMKGSRWKKRPIEFSIELKEFGDLCHQFGIKLRDDLQKQIAAANTVPTNGRGR